GLEIDGKFEGRRQFNWKLSRFLALENHRHISTGAAVSVCLTRAITHQSSSLDKSGCKIARWDSVERGKSNQLGAPTIDERTCTDVEGTSTGSHDGRKRGVNLLFSGGFKDHDLLSSVPPPRSRESPRHARQNWGPAGQRWSPLWEPTHAIVQAVCR